MDSNLRDTYTEPYISFMEDLSKRLDEAMHKREITGQSALARLSRVPQPTINRLLKGKTANPDTETLRKLADSLHVSFDWLSAGVGKSGLEVEHVTPRSIKADRQKDSQNSIASSAREHNEIWEEAIFIKKGIYRAPIRGAPFERAIWEPSPDNAYPFPKKFFETRNIDPNSCRLLTVQGDSMEPYLHDQDMVMVDTSDVQIADGTLYAIFFEGEQLIKQVFKEVGGSIILHSYHQRYPDRKIPPEKLNLIHVIGRIFFRSG